MGFVFASAGTAMPGNVRTPRGFGKLGASPRYDRAARAATRTPADAHEQE